MKTRVLPQNNYKAVYLDGKTLRFQIDDKKPITELEYPEFYDVKLTSKCNGQCPYCYQDSKITEDCIPILDKFKKIFSSLSENNRPFQIAFGGGEPTLHYEFIEILKACYDLGITPNYTTNGTHLTKEILEATKKYCGGVAISCHQHLDWERGVQQLRNEDIKINLHIIISDKESIDRFLRIYKQHQDKIAYFVLLPYETFGRAPKKEIDFEYLDSKMTGKEENIAWGANFYKFLKDNSKYKVSLYEPESMSKYLDLTLTEPKLYLSSFNLTEVKFPILK
jgi:organic radical activating enzyme